MQHGNSGFMNHTIVTSPGERLGNAVSSVLVSAGNLLTVLTTTTSYKVIPNPPGLYQHAIDGDIKGFHRVLDEIDTEIQLSKQQLKEAIETKRKKDELAAKQASEKREKAVSSDDITTTSESQNAVSKHEDATEGPELQNQAPKGEDQSEDATIEQGFDMDSMAFDDDLNALLGSVGQQEEEGGGDMGLFGDDFDFVLPSQ